MSPQTSYRDGTGGYFILTDQQRDRCAASVGQFHLRLHGSAAEGSICAEATSAKAVGQGQCFGAAGEIHDEYVDQSLGSWEDTFGIAGQQDAFHTEGEPDAGSCRTAQCFGQTVIATAATDGVLRTFERIAGELERGAGVVVETANKPRRDLVGDIESVKARAHNIEMGRCFLGEEVHHDWSGINDRLILWPLRVEYAQRVDFKRGTRLLGEVRRIGAQVRRECLHVRRTTGVVTQRVEKQPDLGETKCRVELRRERNDFNIDVRIIGAERFDANLRELSVAARLRSFVAELRTFVPDLPRRSRPMLHIGTHHRCGQFRAERELGRVLLLLVEEVEHLLGHHVGGFPKTFEDGKFFEHRRDDLAVAGKSALVCEHINEGTLTRRLGRENVPRAFGCGEFCRSQGLEATGRTARAKRLLRSTLGFVTPDPIQAPLGDRLDDLRLSGLSRVSRFFSNIWGRVPRSVRAFWPFRIIGSIISLVRRNRVLSLAAEISFWGVLSVVPIVIAAGSALGWLDTIAGTEVAEDARAELTNLVTTLFGTNGTAKSIDTLFDTQNTGAVTISLLISLYSSSRGFTSLIGALGLISGTQNQRNWLMTRVVGVIVALVSIIVMNGLLIVLGLNRSGFNLPEPWDVLVGYGIFPVVFVVVVGWASVLLHWAPRERTPLRYDLPGAALTAIFWIGGSYLAAIYIAETSDASDPVGLLGSGLGLLIWLYVVSSSILIGAQLNAAIDLDRDARRDRMLGEAVANGASGRGEPSRKERRIARKAAKREAAAVAPPGVPIEDASLALDEPAIVEQSPLVASSLADFGPDPDIEAQRPTREAAASEPTQEYPEPQWAD